MTYSMNVPRCAALVALAAAALLAGCEQREQHSAQAPTQPPMQPSESTVAANATDPSLPPADVVNHPKGEQDAAHTATTPDERDRQMPLKGTVNDYNTPDRAKEHDQPRTAEMEPGGQEAKPGQQPR